MDVQLENKATKKGKHIKIFSDSCDACLSHIDNVEVGKCVGCLLEVFPFDKSPVDRADERAKFDIKVHPTTIIDDEIKVEGIPEFYWLCGDEFYDKLKLEYPLKS